MNKLLIIVDMQNDFIDGTLANPDAQKIIPNMVEFINGWDGSIGITLDTHEDNYLDTQEGKNLPIKHCVLNTLGHMLNADIAKAIGGRVSYTVMKPSFGFNNWKDFGLNIHFDEIVLVGTCTDICVISNALILKAAYPELKISVIENLCAGLTKEKHEAAIEVMKSCQIEVR